MPEVNTGNLSEEEIKEIMEEWGLLPMNAKQLAIKLNEVSRLLTKHATAISLLNNKNSNTSTGK